MPFNNNREGDGKIYLDSTQSPEATKDGVILLHVMFADPSFFFF